MASIQGKLYSSTNYLNNTNSLTSSSDDTINTIMFLGTTAMFITTTKTEIYFHCDENFSFAGQALVTTDTNSNGNDKDETVMVMKSYTR